MKTTPILAALGLTAALALSACSSGADDGDQVKLGFITKYNNDYFLAMQDAVEEWDDAHEDVTVIMGQGKDGSDTDGQIALIESMVTQQVDGIAIAPVGEGVQPALEIAAEKGIKIVLVDNDLPDFDQKTAVVATDNFAGGKLAGEWLATQLTPGQTVAILDGIPGVPTLDNRTNGMIEGLGGEFEVVQKVTTECTQEKGVSGAEDILAAHPDVNAIYAACGPPVLGAIQTFENKNVANDDLLLVGFDALPDEAKAILAGTEDATVAQFPKKMGTVSLDSLIAAINGDTVEKTIDTGTEIVTKDNAQKFTSFQ
jgi:ABC-type sugar transport system substrate-binding protein